MGVCACVGGVVLVMLMLMLMQKVQKSAKKCKKVIDNIVLFCYTHNKRYEENISRKLTTKQEKKL